MKVYKLSVGMLQTNCYILACSTTKKALIVDPGGEPEKIDELVVREGLEPVMIVNTHGHYDHIGGNIYFRQKGIPLAINRLDAELMQAGGGAAMLGEDDKPENPPEIYLDEGDEVKFGNEKLDVLLTPGHTPGHICLYSKECGKLFCGDVLFFQSVGRTDLPGGNYSDLMQSLKEKIMVLPDKTEVYPGHGPSTSVGFEKNYNPWLS